MTSEIFGAVHEGDTEAFERLLQDDGDLAAARNEHGVSLLLHTLYHRRDDMTKAVRDRVTAVDAFEAAALGDHARVEELLRSGEPDVGATSPDGFTLLHLACFFGHEKVAKLLLAHEAPVNVVSSNPMQVMPLHSAAAAGAEGCVRRLLEHGADPNARQPGGFTPAMSAAAIGKKKLVRILLEHGADATLAADDGKTARDLAVDRGHDDVARLLEEA